MNGQDRGTVIHTAFIPQETETVKKKSRRGRAKRAPQPARKLGVGERLLRSTAIACALLLGILALKNIDTPWSRAAVNGLESALTMRIDPDHSLGKLDFVKNIMPETSLVFFNISGSAPAKPVSGSIDHKFSQAQPWITYSCDDRSEVRCTMAGTISAVSQLSGGDWCVLVDHGKGVETMYAFMGEPEVVSGDNVQRGARLGEVQGDTLYYEMRRDGSSVEPEGAD